MKFHEARERRARSLFFPRFAKLNWSTFIAVPCRSQWSTTKRNPRKLDEFLDPPYFLHQPWINLARGSGFQLCRGLKEIALELVSLMDSFYFRSRRTVYLS